MSFDTSYLDVNIEDKVVSPNSTGNKEVLTQAWTGLMNELHRLIQEKFGVDLTQYTASQ